MLFNNLNDIHYVQSTQNIKPRIQYLCIVTQPKGIKLSIKMIVEFNIYLISPLSRSSRLETYSMESSIYCWSVRERGMESL